MSPRSPEQFEELRENKKELIRSSALKLFAKKGFFVSSISMIASEAGISKGLIYNYYESKEALLKDIIITGFEKIAITVDPNRDGIITHEEFLNMIRLSKERLISDRRFWTLYFSSLPQPSVLNIVRNEVNQMYDRLIGMFTEYFRGEGYAEPETEALFLGSVLDGISFHYLFNPSKYPLEKVIDQLIKRYNKKEQ